MTVEDYTFVAKREIDKGPVINWIMDQVSSLGCKLVSITAPYSLMYEVEFDEDEEEEEEDPYDQIVAF
jgi:hypothetical protein